MLPIFTHDLARNLDLGCRPGRDSGVKHAARFNAEPVVRNAINPGRLRAFTDHLSRESMEAFQKAPWEAAKYCVHRETASGCQSVSENGFTCIYYKPTVTCLEGPTLFADDLESTIIGVNSTYDSAAAAFSVPLQCCYVSSESENGTMISHVAQPAAAAVEMKTRNESALVNCTNDYESTFVTHDCTHDSAAAAFTIPVESLEKTKRGKLSRKHQFESRRLVTRRGRGKRLCNRPSHNHPKSSIFTLKQWFTANISSPFPCAATKKLLATKSGLNIVQVSTWFINERKRVLKPLRVAAGLPQLRNRLGKNLSPVW